MYPFPAAMSSGGMCFVLMEIRIPFGSLSSSTECSCVLLYSLGSVISEPCPASNSVHLLLSLQDSHDLRCLWACLHCLQLGFASPSHSCLLQLSQTRHPSHSLRIPKVRASPSEMMNTRASRHLSSPCWCQPMWSFSFS